MGDAEPVKFDLAKGSVRAGADERIVLIPVAAIDELARHAGLEPARKFARAVGVAVGRRVSARLGSIDGVRGATLETFVTHLGGELALGGWGTLTLERWGKLMVLVVERSAVAEDRLIAGLLEGAIEAAVGREVHAVALGDKRAARVAITNRKSADRARVWVTEGVPANEILVRLQAGGES